MKFFYFYCSFQPH